MVQGVKPLTVTPASHTSAESWLLIQLPAYVPGKAADNDPSPRAPAFYVGDPDGAPDFWLQPGLALILAVILGMNQHMEYPTLTQH